MDLIIKKNTVGKTRHAFLCEIKGDNVVLVAKDGEPHSEHAVGNTKHILAHLYLLRWWRFLERFWR